MPNIEASLNIPTRLNTWSLIRDHPAAFITALYIFMSIAGAVYSYTLYKTVGLNYFDFADPGDFFTGAFKKPVALTLAVLYFLLLVFNALFLVAINRLSSSLLQRSLTKLVGKVDSLQKIDLLLSTKQLSGGKSSFARALRETDLFDQMPLPLKNAALFTIDSTLFLTDRWRRWRRWGLLIFFPFLVLLIQGIVGYVSASNIDNTETYTVFLKTARATSANSFSQIHLVGGTGNYLIFFDPRGEYPLVVPRMNVELIQLQSPSKLPAWLQMLI